MKSDLSSHEKEIEKLAQATDKFISNSGALISAKVEENAELLLHWMQHLSSSQLTNSADCLLISIRASLREVDACLALGLKRPAIFSLRCEIDLLLSWLYFKDHPVEWETVNSTGEGFKLKKEITTYLATHQSGYANRWGLLAQIRTRQEEEPYRMLSAHIHSQNKALLPDIDELHELIRPEAECLDCAAAVFEVSEYLNDVLLAVYADSWHALPAPIQNALKVRFVSAEQKKNFFA